MSEQEALFRSILDEPDDDAPRLVYADWLEEHGEADRADFIRVQIERARLGEEDPRRPALIDRERALYAAHEAKWRREVGQFADVYFGPFERGFVFSVSGPWPEVRSLGSGLFDAAPIRSLSLRDITAELVRELAGWPLLARVTALTLDSGRLDTLSLESLLDSPHLGSLEAFHLYHIDIDQGGAAALASPGLARLRKLYVVNTPVGNAGVAALAESPHLTRLSELCLHEVELGAEAVRALVNSPLLPRLTELCLTANRLSPRNVRLFLGSGWPANLRALGLSDNQVEAGGAEALAESAALTGLTDLDLRCTSLGDAGLQALAASPYLGRLRRLTLGDNHIGDAGVAALARSRSISQLTELSLTYNDIGPAGAAELARSPVFGSLNALELGSNPLGPSGARLLAASRYLRPEALGLDSTGIADRGIRALAASPILEYVTGLSLSNKYVTDVGAAALADSPYLRPVLCTHFVSSNTLTAAGIQAIKKCLRHPELLARFGLEGTDGRATGG